jgi:cell division protein FtsB
MRYGNRSPWKRFLYSPVSIVIGFILIFILIRAGCNIHDKAIQAEERLNEAQSELSGLQQQKEALSSSIDYLSTPAGVEATLRDKYHAVKEGESVAVIVDPSSGTASSTASSSPVPLASWWSQLMDFIGF